MTSTMTTLLWIISLVTLIILLVFVARIYGQGNDFHSEQYACAEQITASAKLSELTKGKSAGAISCPTIRTTAKGSDEAVMHTLAQDLVNCYELWGNGELLLFDNEGIYCHVCSLIDFEDSSPLPGFEEFLMTEPEGESYLSRLAPGYNEESFAELKPEVEQVIAREETYATIFFFARGENLADKAFDAAVGGAVGYGVGKAMSKTGGVAGKVLVYLGKKVGAGSLCGPLVKVCSGALIAYDVTVIASGALVGTVFPETPDYASFVVLRPWTPETIAELGCTASFAE